MDCLFCKIVKKEIVSDLVFENNNICSFRDINPKAPIHFLIIPKKHFVSVNDLNEKDKDLIGEMVLTAKKLAEDFNISKGYKLLFNVGRGAGQVVDHIHLHLMGGW